MVDRIKAAVGVMPSNGAGPGPKAPRRTDARCEQRPGNFPKTTAYARPPARIEAGPKRGLGGGCLAASPSGKELHMGRRRADEGHRKG